jgi:thioester reductase-like protein
VLGTQEILRLATLGRLKPVHFVSTNTVFYSPANATVELIREDDALQHSHGLPNGYGESKWVAERLLIAARERGIPVAIYRPGRIAWHRHSGVWNSSDLLYKLIKGCLQLGSAPDLALRLEITPVDYVSEAIVRLSLRPQSIGRAFHLVNPQSISWLELAEQIRACGVALPQLPYAEWLRQLQEALRDPAQNALYPLISISQASELSTQAGSQPLELRFDTHNVRAGLAGTGLDYPALDEQLVQPLLAQMLCDPSIAVLEPGAL